MVTTRRAMTITTVAQPNAAVGETTVYKRPTTALATKFPKL